MQTIEASTARGPRCGDHERYLGSESRFDPAAFIVGQSAAVVDAVRRIRRVAGTEVTALVTGETGTGKELAARAIHYMGARHDKPFICVNCGALPEALIENELFGHERGAYTGAGSPNLGLVADAENGTLFLDEVEEMPPRMQAALLRFLQDQVYRPVGSRHTIRANVRIVAASNTNLESLVQERQFRQDLLFRLRLLVVEMPPLRERTGDILLLTRHFLERLAHQYGCEPKWIGPQILERMLRYHWPGNVRELENFLHRAFILSEGPDLEIDPGELSPQTPVTDRPEPSAKELPTFSAAKAEAIREFERSYVHQALHNCGGNVSAAARKAGKERSAFGKLVKKYGLCKSQLLGPIDI